MLSSPFIHSNNNVQKIMMQVQIATLPAMLVYIYFFGWGITIQWVLALVSGLLIEALMLKIRNRPIKPYLSDMSLLITITGLVFCIPPDAPWWLIVSGTAFAIVFGKHLYGGLGYNIFNPAMLGFAFLIISFPVQMSAYTQSFETLGSHLDFSQSFNIIFGLENIQSKIDGLTGATPLGFVKTALTTNTEVGQSIQHQLFNSLGVVSSWAWVNVAFFVGGLWMLYTRSIRWQFPVGFLLTLAIMSYIFNIIDPKIYASASFHLLSGGTMLAAFFIITDPITASTTPRGRLVYAIGIGILVYVIRNWGAFADGVAFAILIMNMCVPLIDQYTKPRVYGH